MTKLTSSIKQTCAQGAKFNSNNLVFATGLGLNAIANTISNITGLIAQDVYNNNPNPLHRPDSYGWNGTTMRFTPQLMRSSYNVIGGW